MEKVKLIELLRETLNPANRKESEDQLSSMEKIIGFTPTLLQIVMLNDLDMPIRQAGVIYLKNMVTQYWKDAEYEQGDSIPFHIHEQDRHLIRESIVDAVVHAPEMIRVQLAVCTFQIVKNDFPGRWTGIVNKIHFYLQNSDMNLWNGAFLCLYQLVKYYEYKKKEHRGPLNEAMKQLLLPMMYDRIVLLLPDSSEQAVLLQKIILKIFYALTQFHLSLTLLTRDIFTQWMEVIRQVADRDIPEETKQVDEDDRPDLPWWKVKKWALHILARVFERYGCPSSVSKEYKAFAEWYIKTFSQGIFQVIFKILEMYRKKEYVSPRVLQQSFCYLEQGVGQAVAWKLLKSHALSIIQDIIFPLMCYSKADEDLWNSDPYEYVRLKYDIYEDLVSPVTAGQSLLLSIVRKRKDMLEKTMVFLVQVLSSPNVEAKHKDGVFHMIGSMGTLLLKKKLYKEQMERMIMQYVFPEFQSPYGFMRARSCWLLQHFEDIKFNHDENLINVMNCIQSALLSDNDLPVKVEAAMALSVFLASKNKVEKILEPNMKGIVQELLKIIKETENDDLTNVMCKFVTTYTEQLTPIATEMCSQLASTFLQVVESEDGADEKAITAMGLLSTIETLINCMDENVEIMTSLEPIALQVVAHILTKSEMEFYEEAFSLIYGLTSSRISQNMWQCFEMIYSVFKKDGYDYFTEMMPSIHNFITVDTAAFLSTEARLQATLDMCRTVLSNDSGEDEECHASKLLEVIILQCQNSLGQYLNSVLEVTIERLLREVKTTELRTMLLQIVIAALYVSPEVVLLTLEGVKLPNTSTSLLTHFVKQWIHDADCFLGLHDRKVCVLGLCTLIQLGPEKIPALQECHSELLPSLVLLFHGLKRAYAAKAVEENEDDDSEEDDDDQDVYDNDVLESDEDELEDSDEEYLEKLEEKDDEEDLDEEGDDDDQDETALESFTTLLDKEDSEVDEYCFFKNVMQTIERISPLWYEALTNALNEEQKKAMQEVSTLADQRKAAAESKKICESGGYNFSEQTTIPSSFNFGGTFGS